MITGMAKDNNDRLVSSLLTLPFEKGAVEYPTNQNNVLIYNCTHHHAYDEFSSADVVHNFYPDSQHSQHSQQGFAHSFARQQTR